MLKGCANDDITSMIAAAVVSHGLQWATLFKILLQRCRLNVCFVGPPMAICDRFGKSKSARGTENSTFATLLIHRCFEESVVEACDLFGKNKQAWRQRFRRHCN